MTRENLNPRLSNPLRFGAQLGMVGLPFKMMGLGIAALRRL